MTVAAQQPVQLALPQRQIGRSGLQRHQRRGHWPAERRLAPQRAAISSAQHTGIRHIEIRLQIDAVRGDNPRDLRVQPIGRQVQLAQQRARGVTPDRNRNRRGADQQPIDLRHANGQINAAQGSLQIGRSGQRTAASGQFKSQCALQGSPGQIGQPGKVAIVPTRCAGQDELVTQSANCPSRGDVKTSPRQRQVRDLQLCARMPVQHGLPGQGRAKRLCQCRIRKGQTRGRKVNPAIKVRPAGVVDDMARARQFGLSYLDVGIVQAQHCRFALPDIARQTAVVQA